MFNIIILGITSMLTDISSEMVYPLLPAYLTGVLGASPVIIGFIEGIAESLASLLKVFSGYFSDKLKKRKALTIAGYSCSVIGKIALYAATAWTCVLTGRIIDRFGKGIRTAPRDALIAESARAERRGAAFGLHRALDTFGACAGVLIAWWALVHLKDGIRCVFLLSIIPALLGVSILFLVREKKAPALPAQPGVRFKWSALDTRLRRFLILTFIFTLGNSSNQFLLLRAQNLGCPLPNVLLLYLVYNVVYSLSSYPAARLSDRIGRKHLLIAGHIFYGIVYAGFAMVSVPVLLWVLFAVYGLYSGFTEGVEKAFISDNAQPHLKATAIGLHAALVGIGLFPASCIAGILWKYCGPQAPFVFGSVMGCAAAAGLMIILRRE